MRFLLGLINLLNSAVIVVMMWMVMIMRVLVKMRRKCFAILQVDMSDIVAGMGMPNQRTALKSSAGLKE